LLLGKNYFFEPEQGL